MARKKVSFTERTAFDQNSLLFFKETVSKYPYCACARLSFLLNLKSLADPTYDKELPYTAISIPDRTVLKKEVDKIEQKRVPLKEKKADRGRKMVGVIENNKGFNPWEEVFSEKTISVLFEESISESDNTLSKVQTKSTAKSAAKTTIKFTAKDKPTVQAKPTVQNKPKIQEKSKVQTKSKTQNNISESKKRNYIDPNDLIDKFLRNSNDDMLIKVNKSRDYDSIDPDKGSLKEDLSNGSETLAQLYIEQGYPEKAITIYKNLSLKFPEKNRYFASLIKRAEKKL